MALGPVTAFDNFFRTVSNGFGTSSSGHAWSGGTSNDAVSAGVATIQVPSGSSRRILTWATPSGRASHEVLCRVQWNGSNPLTDHGPAVRVASGAYYYLTIQDYYGEMAIQYIDTTGAAFEQARTSVTITDHTWYWVRFRADSQLHARIWADGTVEPGTWNITTALATGSHVPGVGQSGYTVRGTTQTFQVSLDAMYWYSTITDAYPAWPITETFTKGGADDGFGWTSTNHIWEGNLSADPNLYSLANIGVVTAATNSGDITRASTTNVHGWLGPVVSGDQEVTGTFQFDGTTAQFLDFGLRGSFTISGGNATWTNSYYAKVVAGSTQFSLIKIVSSASTTLTLTTNTAYTALLANTPYKVRVQVVGTVLQARLWLASGGEPGTWNAAATISGVSSGIAHLVRGSSDATSRTAKLFALNWAFVTGTNSTTVGALTQVSRTDTSLSLSSAFTGDTNANNSAVVQYKLSTDETWTTFGGTVTRTSTAFTFNITGLAHATSYDVQVTISDGDGVLGTNPATNTFSTNTVGTDLTSSQFIISNLASTTLTINLTYNYDTDTNSVALLEKSVFGSGTWTTVVANMTKTTISGQKQYTYNVTGLIADTIYQFRVTITDAGGIYGTNPQLTTVTTLGKGVSPTVVGATVGDTSATVTAFYLYDTNNNSSVTFQYRAIQDFLFTTVPTTNVETDRTDKLFFTTLFPLMPDTTYEVHAIFSDPDGVIAGSSADISTLFTTTGQTLSIDRRTKHYQWKVYDDDGNYVGSWPDAGEPSFTFDGNAGPSDITVTLPRPISVVNQVSSTIAYENRVDVWAIDTTSDGMGPNLCIDDDMDQGSWVLTTSWAIDPTGGPDDSSALKFTSASATVRTVRSEPMFPFGAVALVFKVIARAITTKAKVFVESYDSLNNLLEQSDAFTETVGNSWQTLRLEYTPPKTVSYVKLCIQNEGAGTIWADKCTVLPREYLVYRGRIETYTPKIDANGETVDVQIMGLVSLLQNDYMDFVQYVTTQPTKDANKGRPNRGPKDPGAMMRDLIDLAQQQSPRFSLYYTATSIQDTGTVAEYTFRHHQLRQAFDRIRRFAPDDWMYYIEPDGKVVFRGPDSVATHKLRIGVELSDFQVAKSISNLKNYVYVAGRVDDTFTQPDGYGTIEYVAFDQASIDKYGRRYLLIRDGNITTPDTAKIVGDGRLIEYNRDEDRGKGTVPDEKSLLYGGGTLRGYNIEAFRPGDRVLIIDTRTGTVNNYWDAMLWDVDTWDGKNFSPLPNSVPVVSIDYHGTDAVLSLSERQPSQTGGFAKLYRFLQNSDSEKETQN